MLANLFKSLGEGILICIWARAWSSVVLQVLVLVWLVRVEIAILGEGHKLVTRGRLVEDAIKEATAAADGQLADPDPQDEVRVVSVDSCNTEVVHIDLCGGSAQSGQLAIGVEAEYGCGDEGTEVDASEEAAQAKACHARAGVPGSDRQTQIAQGNQQEGDTAKLVDNCEASSLKFLGVCRQVVFQRGGLSFITPRVSYKGILVVVSCSTWKERTDRLRQN